jgi:hypothetical protein
MNVKTYCIKIDEDLVIEELDETAGAQHVRSEDLIAVLVARAVAPQSRLARKFDKDLQPQY